MPMTAAEADRRERCARKLTQEAPLTIDAEPAMNVVAILDDAAKGLRDARGAAARAHAILVAALAARNRRERAA